MRNIAIHLIDVGLRGLGRRPLLTVTIVYSVAFGAAAFIVGAVGPRDTTCNPSPQRPDPVYMAVQTSGSAGAPAPYCI